MGNQSRGQKLMHVLRDGARRVVRLAMSNNPGIRVNANEHNLGQRRLIAGQDRFDSDDVH
jgi:hypothetical protein